MNYLRSFEYKITPEDSYPIIRNCSLCGGKSIYVNSNNFRMNANGNKIDIWLIYQCKKCKHTYNLPIYERKKVDSILPNYLSRFMENDQELAKAYGTDKSIFVRNKTEIDWSNVNYQIINTKTLNSISDEFIDFHLGDFIQLSNPWGLKVRTDKILATILHIPRNIVKQLEASGSIEILISQHDPNIGIIIRGEIYT